MPGEDDRVTLAVVVSRLDDFREEVRDDLRELREAVTNLSRGTVTRTEWELRNTHVDSKFRAQGREIGDLRAELRAKRQPWTAVASSLVAVAALVITLVQLIAG